MSTGWVKALSAARTAGRSYYNRPKIMAKRLTNLPKGMKSAERKEGERRKRQYLASLAKLAKAGDERLARVATSFPNLGLKIVRQLKDKTIVFAYRDVEMVFQGFRMKSSDKTK